MKTLNWRLAVAALTASLGVFGLASCVQEDEPDPGTTEIVPDSDDATDDDLTDDDPMDDATDENTPGDDLNDEDPMDDATANPMDDAEDDPTEAPTP